jgi:hypothetical protein
MKHHYPISVSVFLFHIIFMTYFIRFSRWFIVFEDRVHDFVKIIHTLQSGHNMDMYAEKTSFFLLLLRSIFCCSPSRLIDLRTQGFCFMVVVSSSNTNITPFFQSCCYMLVVFHSLFSLFIILYVIVPIWAIYT